MKIVTIGFIMMATHLNASYESHENIVSFSGKNMQRQQSEGYASPSISEGAASPVKKIGCKGWQAITDGWQHEHETATFTLRQSTFGRGYMYEERNPKRTDIVSHIAEEIAIKALIGTCTLVGSRSKSPASPYARPFFFAADPQNIEPCSPGNFSAGSKRVPTTPYFGDEEPRVKPAQEFFGDPKN